MMRPFAGCTETKTRYRPGIFQHGHAGFEPTVLFGVFEHVFRNPVFHGSLRTPHTTHHHSTWHKNRNKQDPVWTEDEG